MVSEDVIVSFQWLGFSARSSPNAFALSWRALRPKLGNVGQRRDVNSSVSSAL